MINSYTPKVKKEIFKGYFLHFKNSPKVLYQGGLQGIKFVLKYGSIKRKCVRMIQPINASSPRAVFRGSNGAYRGTSKGITNSGVAMLNAGGISATAGGLTTLVARGYTTSWAHALVLGVSAAFLSLFFLTPQILEKAGINKLAASSEAGNLAKEDVPKFLERFKEHMRPAKKAIHFKQA